MRKHKGKRTKVKAKTKAKTQAGNLKAVYSDLHDQVNSQVGAANEKMTALAAVVAKLSAASEEKNRAWRLAIVEEKTCLAELIGAAGNKAVALKSKLLKAGIRKANLALANKSASQELKKAMKEAAAARRAFNRVQKAVNQRINKVLKLRTKTKTKSDEHPELERRLVVKNYKNKDVFFSAAELGAIPHVDFLESLDCAARKKNGELFIMPVLPHSPALRKELPPLNNLFKNRYSSHLINEITLCENVEAKELYLTSQDSDPVRGIERLARGKTMIVASARQRRKPIPNSNNNNPTPAYGTGACSFPNFLPNRIGVIAEYEHTVGGVAVRIKDGVSYEALFEADAAGGFVDPFTGMRYYKHHRPIFTRAKAMVAGDLHIACRDQVAITELVRIANIFQPDWMFVHDAFDGMSVSPHVAGKDLTAAAMAEKMPSVVGELTEMKEFMTWFKSVLPKRTKIVVVRSNHDEFLDRFLENTDRWFRLPALPKKLPARNIATFIDEARERRAIIKECGEELDYILDLYSYMQQNPGSNVLKHAVDPDGTLATWLTVNEDFYVDGVQCGSHGHLGVGGSKGSVNGQRHYGKVMSGHTHTLEVNRGAYICGHMSHERHGYNKGIKTWEHGFGVIWPGGLCTVLRVDASTNSCGITDERSASMRRTA